MTDTPTDRESVEALAAYHEDPGYVPGSRQKRTASTLRALLSRAEKAEAERDALREAALGAVQFTFADKVAAGMTDQQIAAAWCVEKRKLRAALNNQEEDG